ncbi:MAG: hypothetical protein K2H74_05100, partial [Paramuribaculum sp.]|nr:hypothetical protein [Paramuribaculum sp.]
GDNSPFAIAFLNNISKPDVEFPMTITGVVKDTYRMTSNKQSPLRVGDLMYDFVFNPGQRAFTPRSDASVDSAPTPTPAPATPAIQPPKISMTSDEVDVKVESCQLRNGTAYIDLRLLNTTRTDMRASIGKKDLGTSEVYLYGGLVRNFDDLTITGGGQTKQFGAIGNIILPSGLPVKLSIKVPNVYSDAKGIARLTLAFRGVDSSNSYGTALLSISDIPFGYKDPIAAIIEDTQPRLYFDVDGLDVQVTKAKRTGNKVKFDLILTNNTYSTMRAHISDGWYVNARTGRTAVYDTDGMSYSVQSYSRQLKFIQGNTPVYTTGSFELPSGIPIRITAIVTDYNPTDKVIPVFTVYFRGVDRTNYYGEALLKITNITIE